MNGFELNKIAGAALAALLFAAGSGFVAELIYHPKPAGNAGYAPPLPDKPAAAPAADAAKVEPISVRLAGANVEKGQGGTKACQACHSFDKGGPNKVGPDLWDVVERKKAAHEGFDYSAGLKEKGGTWTYADLDEFLLSPKAYAKGTKMGFAGIASPQERANVIAYLRTLSDSPKPLPAAEKAADKPAAQPAAATEAPKSTPSDSGEKPSAAKPAPTTGAESTGSPAKPAPDSDQKGVPSSAAPAESTAPAAPATKDAPAKDDATTQPK